MRAFLFMSSTAQSPNWREIISARSTITSRQEYLTSTNGALNINGSFTVTGGATSANQTNGQQLVQIVDAGGEAATVTGGKLDVNATASLAGTSLPISGATSAVGVAIVDSSGNQISTFGGGTQYIDGGTPPTHPTGNAIEWSDGTNWQTVSTAKPLPVTATFSPFGTQDTNLKQVSGTTTSVNNGVVDNGTQRVTIASDSTGLVKLAAGANTIGSISNTSFAATQSTAANLNATVVGTGTFATQASQSGTWNIGTVTTLTGITNPLPAGTNVIGHVITDTGSTTAVTGTVTISGTVTASAGTNLNTSALALESGGNLASIKADVDNLNLAQGSTTSGQKGNLALGAVTTAAPTYTTAQSNPLSLTTGGLLRVDGSGVTQPVSLSSTTITGTVAATQSGTWTNTVTQTTAANLNATVIGTGTFSVQTTADVPGTGATNLGKAEDAPHSSGDTGVFILSVRNDGASTSLTNNNGDYSPIATDVKGRASISQKSSAGSGPVSVSTSTGSVALLAQNLNRVGAQIYNNASNILYVSLGGTPTSSLFTVPLAPATYYEVPAGVTDAINGILASGTGTAMVTEEN